MFPVCLTMEETFIATGLLIVVIGTAMGFLVYWAFEKDNEINQNRIEDEFYYYCVNTHRNDAPVQLEGYIKASSEEDAIEKLISTGVIASNSFEFLDLYLAE